jgi:hypothetical protein
MARTVYHVLPRGKGWGCKVSGVWCVVDNCASLCSKETYVAAVKARARQNKPSEVIVHNRNGKIGKGGGSRVTYGADPERHKG